MNKSDVIIIGGVAAGPKTAATVARRRPHLKITLFEKGRHISFGTCGLPYFASGDISSFEELTVTSYGIPRDIDFFRKTKRVEVVTGAEVIEIDRENKRVRVQMTQSGQIIEHGYSHLVIATGASPAKAPFPVPESNRISHFTRPEDAINFRQLAQTGQIGKAVIIGGGFIGCELAEAAGSMWGIETILIEKEAQLLPYILDPEMAEIARRELKRNDIEVMTGRTVENISLDESGNPVVKIHDGDSISADYVFLCLGVRPNVELAMKCGLNTGETGAIIVNDRMQTSDPFIYAGGDCVESVNLVTGGKMYIPMGSLANRHGRVIAENIAGGDCVFSGATGAFLVKMFETNVGAVGVTMTAARKAGLKARELWGSFVDHPDYYPETKSITLKLVYNEENQRLLGLQAVGKGDIFRRIDVFSSFLSRQARIDDLFDFEPGYAPPYAEALDPLHHLAAMAKAQQRGVNFVNPCNEIENKDAIWLDIREPEEIADAPWPVIAGDEDNKYICVPLNDLRDNLDRLNRDKEIMIVCRRGPRSYQAALILKNEGFKNVYIISGGTQAALS
nr:FAD-dependent oxidoreductase [candidate division Zixibacteria bacterium]